MNRRLLEMMKQATAVGVTDDFTIKVAVVMVTPAMAREWLAEDCNVGNRPLRTFKVAEIRESIDRGEWEFNAETIKFDEEGGLLDGQNRLTAIAESGCPCRALIVWGLPRETQKTVDLGSARTAGDTLAMSGEAHYNMIAASLRLLSLYEAGKLESLNNPRHKPSNTQLQEILARHPSIRQSAARASRRRALKNLVKPSLTCFLDYVLTGLDAELAEEFFDKLETGAYLAPGESVKLLRDRLVFNRAAKVKLPKKEVLALLIKAWNHHVSGTNLKFLRWHTDSAFPEIKVPGGQRPALAAVPRA